MSVWRTRGAIATAMGGGRKNWYRGSYSEYDYNNEPRHHPQARPIYVTVVEDPSGDFRKGARFFSTDFSLGLSSGLWPVGMTVEKEGVIYRVDPPWKKKNSLTFRKQTLTPVKV